MSLAPRTPCTWPHCGALARPGETRCVTHRKPTAHARGYTKEWAAYSRAWLAERPWCGQRADGALSGDDSHCARENRRVPARVVDHIVPLRLNGAQLDPTNHQSLCFSCNARKKVAG